MFEDVHLTYLTSRPSIPPLALVYHVDAIRPDDDIEEIVALYARHGDSEDFHLMMRLMDCDYITDKMRQFKAVIAGEVVKKSMDYCATGDLSPYFSPDFKNCVVVLAAYTLSSARSATTAERLLSKANTPYRDILTNIFTATGLLK